MPIKERHETEIYYRQNRKESKVNTDVKSRGSKMRRASEPNILMTTNFDLCHTKRPRGNTGRRRDVDDLPLPSDPYSSDDEDLSLPPAKHHPTDPSFLNYRNKRRLSLGENQPYRSPRDDFEPRNQFTEYYHTKYPNIGGEYRYINDNDSNDGYRKYSFVYPGRTERDDIDRNRDRLSTSIEYATVNSIPKLDTAKDCHNVSAFVPYRTTARRFSLGDVAFGERIQSSFVEYEEKYPISNNSSLNMSAISYVSSNDPRELSKASHAHSTYVSESDMKTKYRTRRRHSLDVNELKMSQSNLLYGSMRDRLAIPENKDEKASTEVACPKIVVTASDDTRSTGNKYKQKSLRRRSLPRTPENSFDNTNMKQEIVSPRNFSTPKDARSLDQQHKLPSGISMIKPIAGPVSINAAEKLQIQASNKRNDAASLQAKNQLQLPNARNIHEDDQSSPLSCTLESGYSTVDDEPESPTSLNFRHESPFRLYSVGDTSQLSCDNEQNNRREEDVSRQNETNSKKENVYEQPLNIISSNLGGQSNCARIEIQNSSDKDKKNNRTEVISNSVQLEQAHCRIQSDNSGKPTPGKSFEPGSKSGKKTEDKTEKLSACSIAILPSINVLMSSACSAEKEKPRTNLERTVTQTCNGRCENEKTTESRSFECTCNEQIKSASSITGQSNVNRCCRLSDTIESAAPKRSERGVDPTMEVLTEVANQILETKKTAATNKEVEELKQTVHHLQVELEKKDNIIKDLKTVVRLMKNLDGTFHS